MVQIALLFFLPSGMADPSMAAIWNELEILRDVVHDLGMAAAAEQRMELRGLETRMRDTDV